MVFDFEFSLEYKVSGNKVTAKGDDTIHYSIKRKVSNDGIKVYLTPKTEIELCNAYLTTHLPYGRFARVFANGYQSWTHSREYTRDDVQIGLRKIGQYPPIKHFASVFGDYDFQKYSKLKGEFHSYSYTYINTEGQLTLLGSLCERTGYTVFHHNLTANELKVQKDVEGVTVNAEYEVFNLFFTEGEYERVFDEYFKELKIRKPKFEHMTGYTSWYNYFGGITERILDRDIDGLARLGKDADIFQIDDGYQAKVGDWLTLKPSYPKGMKYLADKIHSKGYKAGLWLAPFNAQRKAKVVLDHPDWFVTNPKNGKKQLGSIAWGGAYTLDFYKEQPRAYIKRVFDTVLNDWGFDMVKLDFLYSVCRTPRYNKSRGQIMCEAMDFLRECVGDKLILGCGVPLFPAFGVVDFCRISSDVNLQFKDQFYLDFTNQEVPSAKNAMNNTIFRRHLNGRAFVNDPDVFFVRKNDLRECDTMFLKKGILKYTDEQKKLLAEINQMCGDVLFVSDNVGGFDDEQMAFIKKAFQKSERKVLDAYYTAPTRIFVKYIENKVEGSLEFDVNTGVNLRAK